MPMDFPDLKSLKNAAKVHNFRNINKDEKENDFRNALADHVKSIDFIESQEIRTGKGWNQWSDEDSKNMLYRLGMNI